MHRVLKKWPPHTDLRADTCLCAMLCVKAASSIAEEATVVEQAPVEAPIFV